MPDREVHLPVDKVVNIAAPPFVPEHHLVVEANQGGFKALARDGLDGAAKGRLVTRLTGLILRSGHERCCGRGRDVRKNKREGGKQ